MVVDIPILVAFSLRLLPTENPDELSYRVDVAAACYVATDDRTERFLCMKIARFESNYRRDVGDCRLKGKQGELSAWQILPRTKDERETLCRSLAEDAALMIERVRESRAACRALPPPEQLALYTRGSCASPEGRALSRHRWVYERAGVVY